MKSALLTVTLVLVAIVGGINARPLGTQTEYPAVSSVKAGVSYAQTARDTSFFYGHNKTLDLTRTSVDIFLNSTMGNTYSLSFFGFLADLNGRKTSDPGVGISVSVSGHLGGDSIISPLWLWQAGISAARFNLSDFEDTAVDITGLSYSVQIALASSKEFGPLACTAGVEFFHINDSFTENRTGLKNSGALDGLSPFAGIRIRLTDAITFAAETYFSDYRGFRISSAVDF